MSSGRSVVRDLLKLDKEKRTVGVNDDIHVLSSLEQKTWDFTLPTVCDDSSYDTRLNELNTDIASIKKLFYEMYPMLEEVNMDNLVIAGGCLGGFINTSQNNRGLNVDIDVFVYGLEKDKLDERVTTFVSDILKRIKKMNKDADRKNKQAQKDLSYRQKYSSGIFQYTFLRTKNLLNLHFGNNKTVQIIFRSYTSISEVLHGFDLGSSAVGFDGNEIYFTSLGKFAYEYGCNIVDTTRRSTTYEKRLNKYYERGFSIIMPNLDITKLRTNNHKYGIKEVCEIPRFVFSYRKIIGNLIIASDMLLIKSDHSDYATERIEHLRENEIVTHNICELIHADPDKLSDINMYSFSRKGTSSIITLPCYLSEKDVQMFYENIRRSLLKKNLDIPNLKKYITVEDFKDIVRQILIDEKPRSDVILPLIEKQIHYTLKMLKKYKSIPCVTQWKIDNPGTQLVGSFNPIIEEPEKWYGEYFTKHAVKLRNPTGETVNETSKTNE